jgi:hypothetical protein
LFLNFFNWSKQMHIALYPQRQFLPSGTDSTGPSDFFHPGDHLERTAISVDHLPGNGPVLIRHTWLGNMLSGLYASQMKLMAHVSTFDQKYEGDIWSLSNIIRVEITDLPSNFDGDISRLIGGGRMPISTILWDSKHDTREGTRAPYELLADHWLAPRDETFWLLFFETRLRAAKEKVMLALKQAQVAAAPYSGITD